MKNFSQFNEDAESKLSSMSDSQIENLKKNNPGAAAKIDQMRKKEAKKTPSAPAPSSAPKLKTSAIVKPTAIVKSGIKDTAKKVAGDAAKKVSMAAAKKGMDLIRQKQRQSDAGKWSQGIKNAPKSSSALAKTSSSSKGGALAKNPPTKQQAASGSPENKKPGRVPSNEYFKDQAKKDKIADAKARRDAADKIRAAAAAKRSTASDAVAARAAEKHQAWRDDRAKRLEKEKQAEIDGAKAAEDAKKTAAQKDKYDGGLGGLKSALGGDRFTKIRKGDTEDTIKAKKEKRLAARKKDGERLGNAIKSTPGKIGNAIKGLGRAAARTKTSDRQGIEGGDSMDALQKNSY